VLRLTTYLSLSQTTFRANPLYFFSHSVMQNNIHWHHYVCVFFSLLKRDTHPSLKRETYISLTPFTASARYGSISPTLYKCQYIVPYIWCVKAVSGLSGSEGGAAWREGKGSGPFQFVLFESIPHLKGASKGGGGMSAVAFN